MGRNGSQPSIQIERPEPDSSTPPARGRAGRFLTATPTIVTLVAAGAGALLWLFTALASKADAAEFRGVKEEQIRRTEVLKRLEDKIDDVIEGQGELKKSIETLQACRP